MTCKDDTWKADANVIVDGLSDVALLLAWFAWVVFVCWFGVMSDSLLLFAKWFWPNIGDGLVKAGVPKNLIVGQLTVSWIVLMPLLMLAPLLLWNRWGGRSPTRSNVEDGTWTLNLPHHCYREGVWTVLLARESIVNPRFQQARFVLAEGPSVLIPGADLRRALADWLTDPNAGPLRPLKIDFEHNTVNGVPVEMSSET